MFTQGWTCFSAAEDEVDRFALAHSHPHSALDLLEDKVEVEERLAPARLGGWFQDDPAVLGLESAEEERGGGEVESAEREGALRRWSNMEEGREGRGAKGVKEWSGKITKSSRKRSD
eukprot:758144-Hanusia_phi.AAC.2